MDTDYTFPVRVELGHIKVPRLKVKLVKYFQSRKSRGGDCEVDYQEGSTQATVRFRRQEDQRNVLDRGTHEVILDSDLVRMTVRLPTEEKTTQQEEQSKDDTKDEAPGVDMEQPEVRVAAHDDAGPWIMASVVGNLSRSMNQEFLEMLVENILFEFNSSSVPTEFTLELLLDLSLAIVTFQTEQDNSNFVSGCKQNKMFIKKNLSVRLLEATKQVQVEDVHDLSDDILQLYFERNCGPVEGVRVDDEQQSAIITFKDQHAIRRVMEKRHHIKNQEIRVYPFFESLGEALYGREKRPLPTLPPPTSESLDVSVWKFLSVDEAAATSVHNELAKHHCVVNLSRPTVQLSPSPSLLQQAEAKALVRDWTATVKSAFARAVSQFRTLKFRPDPQVWEECEMKIKDFQKQENIIVQPDVMKGDLNVVGYRSDVDRLEAPLSSLIGKITGRAQWEKLSTTQQVNISSAIFHILCQDGLQEKLKQVYPGLILSYETKDAALNVTGLSEEVFAAHKVIIEAILSLKRQNLDLDEFVISFLRSKQQDEVTEDLLTSAGINAMLEFNANRVQLAAVSDRDLNKAQQHLAELLMSQYVDVEDVNVLKMAEWQQLVQTVEEVYSNPWKKIQIRIKGTQVVVSGIIEQVMDVSDELDTFLKQNAEIEETVLVKHGIILRYIMTMHKAWMKQAEDNVEVTCRNDAVCIRGSRDRVSQSKKVIESLLRSVFFESLKISKPGVRKLFQEKKAIYVSMLKSESDSLVELIEDTNGDGENLDVADQPKPVYQLQTSDGVDIIVCKADLCSYPTQAVVNSSSPDLKHRSGLAEALSQAAGPSLQDECNKIIQTKGQLRPGDSIITSAGGSLACRKVIHAVAPTFESAKPQKSLAQLKRAVKSSLELAAHYGFTSVALPVISKNLGFALDLCALTIVTAVKEYCDETFDDSSLKRIAFVNKDDDAVQAMEAAVRKQFGNQGVSSSHPGPADQPSDRKQAVSNVDLYDGQTKEGLRVTLTKGCIENMTTEIIVNIVHHSLSLSKGPISNALLHAAGAKLQEQLKANRRSGHIGDIIETEGCKLQCKGVYHAVAPHWDNGDDKSEKALRKIIGDCLALVEKAGLSSISFPAIGTGNLGFPKERAATVMYEEIQEFSGKTKLQHLEQIRIVLFPSDVQTIQTFCQMFKKLHPIASSRSTSSQSSGYFSHIVSSAGMYETKMGSVTIQVATGDITKETTDVIVNSSNDSFTLKSGVSKAILEAAGQAVEAECQKLGASKSTSMIITQAGNLTCKKILHLVGQTAPQNIYKVVKEALHMCLANSFTSISFPAIGTGQGNVQPKQVADVMFDAIIHELRKNTSSTLKTLRIVVFQSVFLKDFYSSMQERQATSTNDKGFWHTLNLKIQSFFRGDTSQVPQRAGDFVIKPVPVDPAHFHICSDSQAKVDQAKQWITRTVEQEQHSLTIPEDAVLHFSDSDHQLIVEIQKRLDVSVTTECKQGTASVIVEGLSKDVLLANKEIYKILHKVKDQEETKRKVELASTVAEWQYKEPAALFTSFDVLSNFRLEQAWERKEASVTVTVLAQDYTINMGSMSATDSQGNSLEIKRIDKLKDEGVPEHWEPMQDNTSSHAVTLSPGSPEHTEILTLFQASCKRTVTKIERIQNAVLWKSLMIKKRHMEERNSHQNNTRRLFHGTCHTTVATINEHGFNRAFAGKNAANFGNGSYFAVSANYSANDTYSKPNQNGDKVMYVCLVLTGDFTQGKAGMPTPPIKAANSVLMFDSVVDNMGNPNMFVIFHDSHAYPEYLITFK